MRGLLENMRGNGIWNMRQKKGVREGGMPQTEKKRVLAIDTEEEPGRDARH